MFTGLIHDIGRVTSKGLRGKWIELSIHSEAITENLPVGASIAVSGVCLTVTNVQSHCFHVDVAPETVRRTNLSGLEVGSDINLEQALRAEDRFGGHFVQGHVDQVGKVRFCGPREGDHVIGVEYAATLEPVVVEKGSIAVDGVSLTVNYCTEGYFEVMLIPHTLLRTTFSELREGDSVNLEYDILFKYLNRLAKPYLSRLTE